MTKKIGLCLLLTIYLAVAGTVRAEPPAKTTRQKRTAATTEKSAERNAAALLESANGWTYSNGAWVHPEGYKFVNGKVLRTTARTGMAFPNPPGKLALQNAQKLKTMTAPKNTQSEADRKAAERRKNLTPLPAPQTGFH
jgi:hypothetical protein